MLQVTVAEGNWKREIRRKLKEFKMKLFCEFLSDSRERDEWRYSASIKTEQSWCLFSTLSTCVTKRCRYFCVSLKGDRLRDFAVDFFHVSAFMAIFSLRFQYERCFQLFYFLYMPHDWIFKNSLRISSRTLIIDVWYLPSFLIGGLDLRWVSNEKSCRFLLATYSSLNRDCLFEVFCCETFKCFQNSFEI